MTSGVVHRAADAAATSPTILEGMGRDIRPAPAAEPQGRGPKSQASRRRARRERRHELAAPVAFAHDGVARRHDLVTAGLTQDDIRVEIEAGRWARLGHHTVGITTPQPTGRARWYWAVWESGPSAVLDGVTALQACGLQRWQEERVHVSVPGRNRARRLAGVVLHRPRQLGAVIRGGVPRTRPEVAVVRAVRWAASDRQAATVLAMTVQQRISTGQAVLAQWTALVQRPRRLDQIVHDVCDGAHSLGELDFADYCRRRRLPTPTRQVLRRGPKGRIYLDVYWVDYGVHVEIDGLQHGQGLAPVDDALRQNSVALSGDVTLRVPVLGLRLTPDLFMDQVEAALHAAGWRRTA